MGELEGEIMGINLRDKPVAEMGICELVYNDCYVKGKQAMYRNYSVDMPARELIRAVYQSIRYIGEPINFYKTRKIKRNGNEKQES